MTYKATDDILEECFEERVHLAFTMLCAALANDEADAVAHFEKALEIAKEAQAKASAVFNRAGRKALLGAYYYEESKK